MGNLKFRLGVGLLTVYALVGVVALATEIAPVMDAPNFVARCVETAAPTAAAGGTSTWQAFLPGMLK